MASVNATYYPPPAGVIADCSAVWVDIAGIRNGPFLMGAMQVAEVVAQYQAAGATAIDVAGYDCAGPPPPDPNPLKPAPVINPPPGPEPPPPPPAPPDQVPPTDGGVTGGDEIIILIQLIEQLITTITSPSPSQGPGESEKCCKQVVLAISNAALAIAAAVRAVAPHAAPQVDPVTCTQLTEQVTRLLAAIHHGDQAIADAISNRAEEKPLDLSHLNSRADRETADDDRAVAAIREFSADLAAVIGQEVGA